jgi:hypothetical protein
VELDLTEQELRATATALLPKAAFVLDDFEDGDTVGWTGPEPTSIAWVDYIGAEGTSRSLRIDGYSSHFGGMHHDMGTAWSPTGLHFSVRPGSTSTMDAYFVASDVASYGVVGTLFFFADDDGRFKVASDVNYDCGPYVANTWYSVSFNIDWQCQVYDVFIDGTLRQFNVPLREYFGQTPDTIRYIDVYNWQSSTAWWDQIWVSTPGVSTMIFGDGFERGSTCGWSSAVP